jgi:ATP-binding cassette subfamily B protein
MRTFRRLLEFLRPYRRPLIGSLLLAWMAMGLTVLIPLLIGGAVNAIESEHRGDLLPLALALLAAGVLRLLLTVGRRVIAGKVSLAVEFDLRQRFYEHLQKLELAFFDSQQTGQLMSRVVNDTSTFENLIAHAIPDLATNIITLTGVLVILLTINPLLTLFVCIPIPFITVLSIVLRKIRRYSAGARIEPCNKDSYRRSFKMQKKRRKEENIIRTYRHRLFRPDSL